MAKSRNTKTKADMVNAKNSETKGENVETKKVEETKITAKAESKETTVADKKETKEVINETKKKEVKKVEVKKEKAEEVKKEEVKKEEVKKEEKPLIVDNRILQQHQKFARDINTKSNFLIYHRNTLIYNSATNATEIIIRPSYFMIGTAKFGYAGVTVKHV
jgi:hypothetical protein